MKRNISGGVNGKELHRVRQAKGVLHVRSYRIKVDRSTQYSGDSAIHHDRDCDNRHIPARSNGCSQPCQRIPYRQAASENQDRLLRFADVSPSTVV